MEIISEAFALFFYGIYADIYKRGFEKELERKFLSGESVSCPELSAKSNKNYNIQHKLMAMEKDLRRKIYAK